MRRLARGLALGVVVTILVLVWFALFTARPGDAKLWPPAKDTPAVDIFLISNGYHAGLAIPTAKLAEIARQEGEGALADVVTRFGSYPFIEIGWGEEQFYAAVPTVAQMTFGLALRALFLPGNASVLHVVGVPDHPHKVFASADVVRVPMGEKSFTELLHAIDTTFATGGEPPAPQVLGKGLYGPSLFYRANRPFHIFNVCNHWVSDMLSAAGMPVTPVLDSVPAGLLLDLRWRSGLTAMPREAKERS
jgi:uncharacterized protein (TIGR02117 family)